MKGGITKGLSAAAAMLKKWGASLVGTKAGTDLGVPQGRYLYLDCDQATPNDRIGADAGGSTIRLETNGGLRFRCTNTYNESNVALWPSADGTKDLGASARRWADVHVSDQIHLGLAGDNTYIKSSGANWLGLFTQNAERIRISGNEVWIGCATFMVPLSDATRGLGTAANRWQTVVASLQIHIDDGAGNMNVGMRWNTSSDAYIHNAQMTTAQRNAMSGAWGAPEAGRQIFNTTINQMEYWNGVAWIPY